MENVKEQAKTTAGPTLIRTFNLLNATLLVTGVVIGSGVFKKIIPLAQTGLSETWILGVWVIAGIITMLGALNLGALSSLTEESGGVYEYLRLSFGDFYSFLFGWTDFTIIGSASVAALGFIFSQIINSLIPLPNPLQPWASISIAHTIYPFADSGIKILTLGIIITLAWVNYRGAKESSRINNVFSSAKIVGIILLIILGLFFAAPAVPRPETARAAVVALPNHSLINALFSALLSVFWAYDGWMDLSFITGEIKNPKRNLPRAIILGISIAIGLYILVNAAYMHTMLLGELAAVGPNQIGAAVVAERLIGSWGKSLISILILVSVFSSLNAVLLSHTRIYFRMAQEGYFFRKAARVHPTYRTPYMALLYTTAWSCVLVVSGTFDILTDMVIFANFIFYGLLALAVVKLKHRGVIQGKVPGFPLIQIIIMLFASALLINTVITQPQQSLIGIGLVLSGVPLYLYFKKQKIAAQ